MDVRNQHIVILGGSSGIGLAVAQAATRQGARVTVASSNPARVAEAVSSLPEGTEGHALDLLNGEAVDGFFRDLGSFDHLVFTAGEGLQLMPLDEMTIASAKAFFELRYWGALTAVKAAHARLRPGGSIVFTSGIASNRPGAGWSVAASICAAMEALTRALAVELAPLRVNIVSPGVVKSPLWSGMDEAARAALYAAESGRLPVGHVGEPEEIAEAYLYLIRQTYVTGQVLQVEGGGLLV